MKNIKYEIFKNYGQDEYALNFVKENINKVKVSGRFKGCNNLNIYYEFYKIKDEKGGIVISHGFSECIEKYNELIYYFMEMGYSVYAIEHRGHGRSGSLGKYDKTQINIDKFEYYVEDFKKFLDLVVVKESTNLYLYAHSMGGAIGIMFLEKYNQYFKKAILNAPMLEINTGKYPKLFSYLMSEIYVKLGRGDEFVFGHGPFYKKYDLDSSGTSNKYRYKNHLKDLYNNKELQRGGASFKWLNESLKACNNILKKSNISNIKIPILFFQAGKDKVVNEGGQNKFCDNLDKCKKIKFENGKHELYMEDDNILKDYLKYIREFLK